MADELTAAQLFAKAWCEVKNPELDGENPHFRSKYASLKATLGVIREACQANGLAYVQQIIPTKHGMQLKSSVMAQNGDSFTLSLLPVSMPPNPQAFGSELTYKKRQQAQTDWGLAGESDDDANAAKPSGPFMAHCRSCGARYKFQSAEQMATMQCCPSPDYEVE